MVPSSGLSSRIEKRKKEAAKTRAILFTGIALVFLTVMVALSVMAYRVPLGSNGARLTYIETFDNPGILASEGSSASPGLWHAFDCQVASGQTVVKLSKYAAPHLEREFLPQESQTGAHLAVSVVLTPGDMAGQYSTLFGISFPTGPLAVIMGGNGRVGIARGLFDPPIYGNISLKYGKPCEIRVCIDSEEHKLSLYVDERLALSTEWESPHFPVLKMWLGTMWLGGAGAYAAPGEIQFDTVSIGGKDFFPLTGFARLRALPRLIQLLFDRQRG